MNDPNQINLLLTQEKSKTREHKRWNDDEIKYIQVNHTKISVKEMAVQLGRTPKSIRRKCDSIGIKLPYVGCGRWNNNTIKTLETLFFNGESDILISEKTGHSVKAVVAKRAKLRLLRIPRRDDGFSYLDSDGYYKIYKNGKRCFHHVIIAEEAIGRRVSQKEKVHHINFEKTDNQVDNLLICTDRSEHFKLHFQPMTLIKTLIERNIINFDKTKREYFLV